MKYLFHGSLTGLLCGSCSESLAHVTVRLYRVSRERPASALAVADPKDTFRLLDDSAIEAKRPLLIAETTTDAAGAFRFELGKEYDGGPFEVDVWCETVPGRKPTRRPPPPLQFSITTLQPLWRERKDGYAWNWAYTIPSKYWCAIRGRFQAWVICGRVVDCDAKLPIPGLRVFALDRDWLQDDALGSGLTDAAGHFRIDYTDDDFSKTIFGGLRLELLTPGPDVYFRIESGTGVVLLKEAPDAGRAPGRENVPHCFCAGDLCVLNTQNPQDPTQKPWFTSVGKLDVFADIDAAGKVKQSRLGIGGPGWGFFGALELGGFCPKVAPGVPGSRMRYRFRVEHPSAPGVKQPITGSRLAPVRVGSRIVQWDTDGQGLQAVAQAVYVAASAAEVGADATTATPPPPPAVPPATPWGPPPPHVIVPDSVEGWIEVDQQMLDGGFFGVLLGFRSETVVPGGAAPSNGAGNAVAPANQRHGIAIQLHFEAETASGGSYQLIQAPVTLYVNNWPAVRLLGLQQFVTGGSGACTGITGMLDILYTVDHEFLSDDWRLSITSASPSAPGQVIPPAPAGTTPRGHAGTRSFDISAWQHCSYLVQLHTRRNLTTGVANDSNELSLLTFCH
jgi:hypothetical protein